MARGIVETGLGRTERLALEERTTDPSVTAEGYAWIRTDIAPDTDQIATLRFDNGTDVWELPIYSTSASPGENVEAVWRVQTGGQLGFIPVAASGATFPAVKFQHAGSQFEAHDALTASAIPDSGLVHNYDAENLSVPVGDAVTSWSDSVGTLDIDGGHPTYQEDLNGNPTVRFDGGNDILSNTTDTAASDRFTLAFAVDITAIPSGLGNTLFDNAQQGVTVAVEFNGSTYRARTSSEAIEGGSATSQQAIWVVRYDGNNSAQRINGTEVASGYLEVQNLAGLRIGGAESGYFEGGVSQCLVYNEPKANSEISEIESYLSNKWGIAI